MVPDSQLPSFTRISLLLTPTLALPRLARDEQRCSPRILVPNPPARHTPLHTPSPPFLPSPFAGACLQGWRGGRGPVFSFALASYSDCLCTHLALSRVPEKSLLEPQNSTIGPSHSSPPFTSAQHDVGCSGSTSSQSSLFPSVHPGLLPAPPLAGPGTRSPVSGALISVRIFPALATAMYQLPATSLYCLPRSMATLLFPIISNMGRALGL